MASGKTHDQVGFFAGSLLGFYLYFQQFALLLIAWILIGYAIGILWLSPDLDLPHSRPTKRWKYLKFLALPYSRLLKHRGISHWVVIGTLTRAVYLLPMFYFYPDFRFILSVLIGLELSALVHLLCDYTPGLRRL